MHIAYTAEQADLLERVRALLAEIMTPELRAECADREGGGPIYHQAMQRLGRLLDQGQIQLGCRV